MYKQGSDNAKKLAIITPGRLDTKDYVHNTSLVKYLSEKGFLAVSFDPPGTWESPGDISLYTTTNTLKAINELIEYFGNRPTVLLGHSRGGANAMLAGAANQYVTHLVGIMSPHAPTRVDLPKPGEVHPSYRDLPPGTERTKGKREFLLPYSYFEDQEQYDALDGLRNCTKPKLFFYGTQDDLVPEAEVREAYDGSAEPKEIHAVKSEHDYRLHPEIIEEVNEVIGSFLQKYS